MSGLYVQLDATYAADPKVLDLDDERSELLFIRSLAYCKLNLTDGFIHRRALGSITPSGDRDIYVADLVRVGLWTESERGWYVTAWLKRNMSADEVNPRRQAENDRKKVWRDSKKKNARVPQDKPDTATDTRRVAENGTRQTGRGRGRGKREVKPRHRTPLVRCSSSVPNSRHLPVTGAFDGFWSSYPRKVAKQEALKAWRKAVKGPGKVSPTVLSERLAVQKRAWATEGRAPDKVPHAATWLNGRRWEDDDVVNPPPAPDLNDPYAGQQFT